jgi:nucleotide-binding universal stress UspA family protein
MTRSQGKLTTLLVAADLSRGAENALERAVQLPLGSGAKICLLHVLPGETPRTLRSQVEEKAGVELERLASLAAETAKQSGNSGLIIAPKIVYGQAYVEIIRNARASASDLIVTGRHGKRAVRHLRIGSTAIRVIRKSDIPVLIVNRKPATAYRKPLVAIALEDTARAVLDLALQVLDPVLQDIPVVHAYWPPFEDSVLARLTPKEVVAYQRDFKRRTDSDFRRLIRSLSNKGSRWKPLARRGDPRSVVLEEAARRRSDLIVIGTHARSGLSHILLGSVAEWVISSARCDILVARPSRFSFQLP